MPRIFKTTVMIKRLIIIHPHFTIYTGATMFVLELAKHLSKMGVDIKIITITTRAAIVAPYKQYMQFTEIGGPLSSSIFFWVQLPLSTYRIHKLLNKLPHDGVFTQVFPANWWGGLLKLFNPSLKLVWMCQEPSAFIHSNEWIASVKGTGMKIGIRILRPLLRALDIYFTKKHDFVIANSKFTLMSLQNVYKISAKKSTYCHLGVDTDVFESSTTTRLNQFLVVTSLTKFKNPMFVLETYKEFVNTPNRERTCLKFIGKGPELAKLTSYIQKNNLNELVTISQDLTPSELLAEMQKSTALILASREPFGLVVAGVGIDVDDG